MAGRGIGIALLAGLLAATGLAQDKLEGPWGTFNGDLYGRARIKLAQPLQWGTGTGAKLAWDFDPLAQGLDRPGGAGPITFDKDGNLYWKTTAGNHKVASVTPAGTLRWIAQDTGGADFEFGAGFNDTAVVIGEQRCYAVGVNDYAGTGEGVVAAFNKATGALVWKTQLPDAALWTDRNQATPVLYNGKLYLVGTDGFDMRFYQVDATTGAINWTTSFFIEGGVGPQVAFVPDVFGAGQHGLYFPVKDTGEDVSFTYGFKITATTATQMWSAVTGKLAHSRIIYNPVAPGSTKGRLYVPTWNDYGTAKATMYAYDPVTGASFSVAGTSGGHGFYDVGALDWDDQTIIAGGFEGRFGLYTDQGDGTFAVDMVQYVPWYGEPRVVGALTRDCASDSVMVTGTNSRSDLGADHQARVIAVNLTKDVHGCFDDSPLYIDDVKVWDGDMTGTLLVNENFNSYTVGKLAPQGGWEDDNVPPSGDDETNPAVVIVEPELPSNKVMKLDAAGCGGGWIGAYLAMDDTTSDKATIQWRQKHLADYRDNLWFAWGDFPNDFNDTNGWIIGWDVNGKMSPWEFVGTADDDPRSIFQKVAVWQTVTIVYDYANLTATIQIDAETGAPIKFPEFTGLYITGVDFQVEGTALSDKFNLPMVEYNTGVLEDHGFTLRGGPLPGPDGKLYYFDTDTRHLIALSPQTVKGDANCDGVVNAFDIDSFVQALTDEAGWKATHTCDFLGANDTNNDKKVDAFDIDPFVAILTDACP